MKKLDHWFRLGRVWRLRVFLIALVVLTAVFAFISLNMLNTEYQQAGSWHRFWVVEWRSGDDIIHIAESRLFQLFVLILSWSIYFRLRQRELSHLRLRRSEQKYRNIINNAGEAIFLLDAESRVLEWNKAAEHLFGVPRRLVLNRPFGEIDSGLDLDRLLEDARHSRGKLSLERRVEMQGRSVQIDMTFSRIAPRTGLLAEKKETYVVIARDITSLKQLETQMSQTEKMAGIGQLAAGIAHQLNTPLGSILLSAQMLEEVVRDEDAAEDIRRIIRQTEQCRGTIKGLLNFARPTGSGRGRIDLGDVVRETGYLMEKNLKLAGVELIVEEETDSAVFGNRNELEQVIFNLLANALDAMPGGGEIRVYIGDGDPGEVLVRFCDSGDGISAEHRDRVFLPFFTTKDYGKGTGLGLSIVARIVHEHGGRIELNDETGRGTEFQLSFPRSRGESAGLALIDDEI